MRIKLLFCLICFFYSFPTVVYAQDSFSQLVSSPVPPTELEKAVFLERVKSEIDFCRESWGKSFDEVDVAKIGITWGYGSWRTDVISYGLIASKYGEYGDSYKAAEYYYKDYLCERFPKRYWKSKHNWPGGPGDSRPFSNFMGELEYNQEYQKMLRFYPEYYDYLFLTRYSGSKKQNKQRLEKEIQSDPDVAKLYKDFMGEWNATRKLAADRTIKPKSLHPAVQNHEWFYSDKQDEVLKALSYYHKNRVKFMLEKALVHKDKAVQAKASEYLENLAQDKNGKVK